MFKGKKQDPSATDTLIGEDTQFEGKLHSDVSIRIEGRLIGEITCGGDVIIGEQGSVQSDIKARNVIIAGEVMGNIQASGKLTLTARGRLNGNIQVQALVIEEGGSFQGISHMTGSVEAVTNNKESKENRAGKDDKASA